MSRARPLALLRESAQVPVVLVTAGAGYGKTTVLSQRLDEDARVAAWLSVSKRHDDPRVLLADVIGVLNACEPFEPVIGRGLIGTEADFSSVVIPRLERAISSRRVPFVLVLDDVHRLHRQTAWGVVQALAEHLPAGSQLLMATRNDPQLPLRRMRADGRLITIETRDLAMTAREGADLLHGAGVRLGAERAEQLVERTEGWPVGLYLAALSLREQESLEASSLFAGDDHLVADYLRDELVGALPKATREFFVRTSILEHLSGELCDAVLERTGSAAVLEDAAGSNLLVFPLDRRGERYRYHHLLREMLSYELRRREPELEPVLHDRASRWFEAHGDPDAAITHALDADDPRRVDALVWSAAPLFVGAGRTATVQRWLESFSPTEIADRPALVVSAAWAAFTVGDMRAVEYWATIASGSDPEAQLPDGTPMRGAAALLQALVARHGLVRLREDAAIASEHFAATSPFGAVACYLEGVALRLLGDPIAAEKRLNEAVSIGEVLAPAAQVHALTQLALLAIDADQWNEASVLTQEIVVLIDRFGFTERPAMACPFAVAALVHARSGSAGEARTALKRGLFLLSMFASIIPWLAVEARLVLARAALLLGDPGSARSLCREADRLLAVNPDGELLTGRLRELEQSLNAETIPLGMVASSMSPAEMRVLRYLPTRLTFAAIADELFVSRNTIKSQAVSIYRKLGVTSRDPAVESARALGLIEG